MNYFLGIDPGKTGAYAVISEDLSFVEVYDYPGTVELLADELHNLCKYPIELACLEKVGAAPGQGVTSMFSFGANFGAWQALLCAYKIPYFMASPQKWLYRICQSKKRGEDSKVVSIAHAKRRFPQVELSSKSKTGRSLKKPNGRADALNISLYGRKEWSEGAYE